MHAVPFMQLVQRHTEYGYVLFITDHYLFDSAPLPDYGAIK